MDNDELKATPVADAQDMSTISRGENNGLALEVLSPAQNRHLFIRTNLVIMPLLILGPMLAFLDKNSMAFGAVYGMRTDTHLVGQEYSWLGSIFYFGYLVMEFPTGWILTKLPPNKILGTLSLGWGTALCLMAVCSNFAGLATVRFFLGMFEGVLLPCSMTITATWYRREEHGLLAALYNNTLAGIIGGILAYAIGHIDGSLASWKYLFIIYGSITVAFGFIVLAALPDSPSKAWFFNKEEKRLAILRLAANQTGITTHRKWKLEQILESLRDPKYWVLVVFTLSASVTNSGVTNFNPLIISGYGFSPEKTTLMSSPQAAVALVAQISTTVLSMYIQNIRCLLWVLSCLPALTGAVMIHTLDINKYRTASLAGVYLMGFYSAPICLMFGLVTSNNSGASKKAFANVTIAVCYAVGNIIGPQFFLDRQAPYYELGIGAMLTAFALNIVLGILYALFAIRENRRRDRVYGKPTTEVVAVGLEVEEEDLTDGKNINFRYAY